MLFDPKESSHLSYPSLPVSASTTRSDWSTYFLDLAELVATRATCNRLHVGCVLVRDNRVIATGYNGSLPGAPDCTQVGHAMKYGHCVRTVHAEINAVLQCAKFGVSCLDAVAFVTHTPCQNCIKLMKAAGVSEFYYRHDYPPRGDNNSGNKN